MIELYKIFMGKYDSDITLKREMYIQRQYDTRNHRSCTAAVTYTV